MLYSKNILFHAVQMAQIFTDSKTFADAVPKIAPSEIDLHYQSESRRIGFDLKVFVEKYYHIPTSHQSDFLTDTQLSIKNHLENLWPLLEKTTIQNVVEGDSLLPLPAPFIVPGGRFQEVYYWDSYFTMLGLAKSGEVQRLRNMVNNFAFLINQYGHIPNGNRAYYLSRSQPPFFGLMVQLLADTLQDQSILIEFLPALRKEYDFWMDGQNKAELVHRRCVQIGQTSLNRYFDDLPEPRPESYREDVELAENLAVSDRKLRYQNIRAAAESGWDFSSRWLADGQNLASIETTNILPIDLNCLLFQLESILATAYSLKNESVESAYFSAVALARKQAIESFFWNEESQFFVDYHFVEKRATEVFSLAGVFPLFFKIATQQQATAIAKKIEADFLKPGGLLTTLHSTGQQWDAPNGWAPLQWICYKGLQNYGFEALAEEIKNRWLAFNEQVYMETGKMMEKYNVLNPSTNAGGGEYPNQDGFGWTNGVFLAMLD
jgi:alpha,alpha-trehalase